MRLLWTVGKILLVIVLFAAVVYAGFWMLERRRSRKRSAGRSDRPAAPARGSLPTTTRTSSASSSGAVAARPRGKQPGPEATPGQPGPVPPKPADKAPEEPKAPRPDDSEADQQHRPE